VIHLFNQPLAVARPYEAYMGTLAIPRIVTRAAEEHSIHVDLLSPRSKLVEAIELAVPGIRREHIHVWTLGGRSRAQRLSGLWEEWRALGVHLVEDGWRCPSGQPAFTESGTYAPTYLVGTWKDGTGLPSLPVRRVRGSAEAVQATSLSKALDLDVPWRSSRLVRPSHGGRASADAARPDASTFHADLGSLLGTKAPSPEQVEYYRSCLLERVAANLPGGKRVVRVDDFFPEKNWRVLAATGYIGDDPYTGLRGVTKLQDDTYEVATQLASRESAMVVRFVFRFLEPLEQSRLIFSPLLERFIAGEDYRRRAVKVSDSGRIRNELQTLCSQALEYRDHTIRIRFERIDDAVIPPAKKTVIRDVLEWYKSNHPVWFSWLEID
jgi:hypothetical protein